MALKQLLLSLSAAYLAVAQDPRFNLFFVAPGEIGNEATAVPNALVIGNGRLGAITYGQPENEVLTINEDSIYSGDEQNRLQDTNGPANFPLLREQLLANNVTDATNNLQQNFLSNPITSRMYAFMADFNISFPGHGSYSNYQRYLDIQNAVTGVTYDVDGVTFTRQWIASNPAKTIIGNITASKPGSISFTAFWYRHGLNGDGTRVGNIYAYDNGALINAGLPSGAPNYAGLFNIYPVGAGTPGSISNNGGEVTVTNADSVLIVIGCETDYWNDGYDYEQLSQLVEQDVSNTVQSSWSSILSTLTADFTSFFNRANLWIDSPATNATLDFEQRFSDYYNGNPDYAMEALMWSMGRYLMISCSRDGSLPPNLLGIWNNNNSPGWGGKFTTDLNVEMNHWMTETTALSEMSNQLFAFTQNRVMPNGEFTAKTLYNCSGWMSHHNNDVWGDTAPHDDGTAYTWWTSGGMWPMTHLYEHWRFTGDNDFLSSTALPILTGLVEFYQCFLIERDGYLVTAPSASTENNYYTPSGDYNAVAIGPTADNYFLTEILTNFLNASYSTGSNNLVSEAEEMLSKIRTPFVPNYYGGVRQWWDDWEEAYQGQPMMDSILGLYPFAFIPMWQPNGNVTQMANASLQNYLGELDGNSWSIVWPIGYYARLWNGDDAYSYLKTTMNHHLQTTGIPWTMNSGTYQIDGNLGLPACMTELLLQSQGPAEKWPIMILPALPSAWQTGHVQGLVARGGFQTNIQWENGNFVEANLYSNLGWNLNISVFVLPEGKNFMIKETGDVAENGYIFIHSQQGMNYTVIPC